MTFTHPNDDANFSASGFNLVPRGKTYIHPSWLSKAIAAERQCLASLFLQANYQIPRKEDANDFDLEGYKLRHQTALTQYAKSLRSDGYTVHSENANSFWYTTKAGAELSAKPDLVAIRGDEVIVPDIKTGKELRASDIAQVKLYMSMIPVVGLHGVDKIPIGQLVHRDKVFEIEPSEITIEFKQQVADIVGVLCSGKLPPVTPSASECRFCPLNHVCPYKDKNMARGADDWL